MNVVKNLQSITEKEVNAGIFGGITAGSWHEKYEDSAWVFIGGLHADLCEGDVICVASQWGEVEDINLCRDKVTNKSLGYGFIKFCDQRSTILIVDNLNGCQLLGRTLRVDHVAQYKLPKEVREREEALVEERLNNALNNGGSGLESNNDVIISAGHAYSGEEKKKLMVDNGFDVEKGVNLWEHPTDNVRSTKSPSSSSDRPHKKKEHRHKSHKSHKSHKEHKHKRHREHEALINEKQNLDLIPSSSVIPVALPAPTKSSEVVIVPGDGSWRGRKDPAAAIDVNRKPISRDSHTTNSYAGMNRLR